MCREEQTQSPFYRDADRRDEAIKVSEEFAELREKYKDRFVTKVMPNGVVVTTTNPERLKLYEQYCRRKTRYFSEP